MYAVILTGGKQYRAEVGKLLKIEKLEVAGSEPVIFDQVLLVADGENIQIGSPYVKGVKVTADVIQQGRAKKIEIIKFKRRKHQMKHQGHRQYYTQVKIKEITAA